MDPYAPCLCGSGKKVKFCCQAILPEMSKIERLQENNQPRMALKVIDKLLKEHKENGWLVTQKAMALFNDDSFVEARDCLLSFLRKEQEHPLANALLAIAVSQLEPIEKAKKVIHRAFIKSMAAEPHLVSLLASKLVSNYLEQGLDMAARQHMAIVMRLGNEEERQRTLMAMLELDSDTSVPYPLRGPHPLPRYTPNDELLAQFKKSQRLYVNGCFSESADILDKLTESDPNSPELWHTIGLMRAWDGDEEAAAKALHTAARLYNDFETTVDLETIAQLLDRRLLQNTVASRLVTYNVETLSRLLTRLDNDDHLCRVPVLEGATRSAAAATYDVLDREIPTEAELENLTLETAPRSIARITLVDQTQSEKSPVAHITGIEGERLHKALEMFEKAAGEMATRQAVAEDAVPNSDVTSYIPKDELVLIESAYFPPKTPVSVRKRMQQEFVHSSIKQTWLNTPQSALNDKSPLEAASDASLKVQLAAAVRVFDSFMDRRDLILDQDQLCEQLGIPKPESLPVSDGMDLYALTVPQMQHLDFKEMSDELFNKVMQRALVLKHCGHGYQVLNELLQNRPALVQDNIEDAQQAYATVADICSRSMKDQEALQWIEQGYVFAKDQGAKFENLLMWKMRELSFRAQNQDDPKIKDLLLELWNHYGSKLPVVRQRLQEFVNAMDIDAPWENAILLPSDAGWSEAATAAPQGAKKLWLGD